MDYATIHITDYRRFTTFLQIIGNSRIKIVDILISDDFFSVHFEDALDQINVICLNCLTYAIAYITPIGKVTQLYTFSKFE